MTITGTVRNCTMKESGKSARLELNERQTRYTLFDIKHVPALQPGVPVTFEAVERTFKETTYWAVVDGSLRYPHAAVGATKPDYDPSDEYAAFEQMEAKAVDSFQERKNPPQVAPEDLIVVGARIATALERIVQLLENK